MDDNNIYSLGETESQYNFPVQEQNSKSKIWLWVLIPVLILVVAIVLFFILKSPSNTISDKQLSQGIIFQLKANNELKFMLENQEHSIKLKSVNADSVDLIIQSKSIQIKINVDETKKIDLDNDGIYDIDIKLNSIDDGVPEISMRKIHEQAVKEKTINPDDITMDIILPKTDYNVDENTHGMYYLKYNGTQFKGAIFYCGQKGCSETRGLIKDVDFNNPNKIHGLSVLFPKAFYSKGTYKFSMYIYDCKDIDKKLDTNDCGQGGFPPTINADTIVSKVKPLKEVSKTVTVTGENKAYAPECKEDRDCTQTCTNCKEGNYVCAYSSSNPKINQKCVECITDFSCKDGFECVDNVCVVKKEDNKTKSNTSSVIEPKTILDCYSKDLSKNLCSPEKELEFTTKFENRLKSCEVSQGTFALGFEPLMGLFRGYEIQGEQDGNCIVKFWFLKNSVIDSSLLNKSMSCAYDSSKRTTQSVNDCLEGCCSGDLVDVLVALEKEKS